MNKGRAKCERLKKIRKAMADRLHVDLHQKECTFEGNCRGTCPKCKQEEEILNRELLKRAAGLGIGALAGLSLAGCAPFQTAGEAPIYEEFEGGILEPVEEYPEPEAGEAPYYEESEGAPMEEYTDSIEGDMPVDEEWEEVLPVEDKVEGLMPYEEEVSYEDGHI